MKDAPYGWDTYTHTEVIPKPAPLVWVWHIGLVTTKPPATPPDPGPDASLGLARKTRQPYPTERPTITMQLTADQQVELSITGTDRYGNAVDISGDVVWQSSDESIIAVEATDPANPATATAKAVGPAGTAAVTVTNDADRNGTGDFMGSIAIDVVAGEIAEIEVAAGTPTDKLDVNPV